MTSSGGGERQLPREIAQRLRDLRLHWETLEWAVAQIGDAFPRDAFIAAATSADAAQRATVFAVERGFEVLVNTMDQLAQAALVHVGVRAPEEELSAGAAYRDLVREGAISGGRCERLIELNRTRNDLQHDYPIVRPDRLYDAVTVLRAEFGPFVRAYARWFRERRPD